MLTYPLYETRLIRTLRHGLRPYLLTGGIPAILANLWVEDLLHSCALNTTESYLRDIAIAYEWASRRGVSLEGKLERLSIFSPIELNSLAQRLCSNAQGQRASQSTCLRRFESIKSFIDFSFDHYVELRRLALAEQTQAELNKSKILKRLRKKILQHSTQAKPSVQASALTDTQVSQLIQVLDPRSPSNPFSSPEIRARNFCLIQVMLETLSRRGEAVLIELDDVDLGYLPTIRIKKSTVSHQQLRKDGASLKTRGRVVPITHALARALDDYISHHRDKLLAPRRPSTALFVSSRDGRRMSARTVNAVVRTLATVPELGHIERLHPHGLRSTAANRARRLLEQGSASSLNVTDSLAFLGGWSPDSPMVQRYTQQSISDRLGQLLRQPARDATERGENDGKSTANRVDPQD